MKERDDKQIQNVWHYTRDTLYTRTNESRNLVKKKANISDTELKKILPIHPYAALLLKHISSAFDSNQRSMFDFIKNDRGDEIKGFQYFIDNFGPIDENPLLTIDMLWDFFYEKGKEFLTHEIRTILDCYPLAASKNLTKDEKRVLKTVLLLEAISHQTGDTVELFVPNEANVNYAFEGSDLENYEASKIANRLVPEILYKKPLLGNKFRFSALINSSNTVELEKEKKNQQQKSTSQLLQEMDIESAISLRDALRLRYVLRFVSRNDFKTTINSLRAQEENYGNKIIAVFAFAKDDAESVEIGRLIKEAITNGSYNMVFVDASTNPFGKDLLEQYIEPMANSVINLKQDKGLAAQYESNAKEILKKWKNKIVEGEFLVYSPNTTAPERVNNLDQLYPVLERINRNKYPEGLETGRPVNSTMWNSNSLKSGVECGVKETVSGPYKSSNEQTKLENYIGADAWQVKEYWKSKPYTAIAKIKIEIDKLINSEFKDKGQISIDRIYSFLSDKDGKYGFMPCNLTAFVMGFLLKEYTDGSYNWTDGIYNETLTIEKLKEMVDEIIKHRMNSIPRYKDKFICTMTPAEKKFNEASSKIFNIPLNLCITAENTRDKIRQKMKDLSFPIWVLKHILNNVELKVPAEKVSELIDDFAGIANNNNFGTIKSDKEIAMLIGEMCINNPGIIEELTALVNSDTISKGMDSYLHTYSGGKLITLAKEVGDDGQYINCLKEKFKVDAANWVWNIETANQKIDELIIEYEIIAESNKVLPKNTSFRSTVREWCDRCGFIRISYLYAKNYWGDLSEFMEMLYDMKKSGDLLSSQREKFLLQLTANGKVFNGIRQLISRLYKYPEKCYNNHKVQRSPRKSRDSVEQDGS